jgi:hypothetical protein
MGKPRSGNLYIFRIGLYLGLEGLFKRDSKREKSLFKNRTREIAIKCHR